MGLALELAKVALPQAQVRRQSGRAGLGNRLRRVPGPGQVAGVHRFQRLATQRLRHLGRLPAAAGIEADVELALDAGSHIPGSLAVANGNDAGGLHRGHGLGLRH